MPEEAEAGDVGSSLDESALGEERAGDIEGSHEIDRGSGGSPDLELALDGRGEDAGAERLGEDEEVSRAGTGVGDESVGMDETGDGKSVEGLGILDGVPAGEDAASFGDLVGATAEDVVDSGQLELVKGDPHDIHGGDGSPPHGIHVGKGVGGGDLPVSVGVVDDRGEEIHRLDQGAGGIEAEHGRIIGGGSSDEKVVMPDLGESAQDLREIGLAEFGGSAGAGGQVRKASDVFA